MRSPSDRPRTNTEPPPYRLACCKASVRFCVQGGRPVWRIDKDNKTSRIELILKDGDLITIFLRGTVWSGAQKTAALNRDCSSSLRGPAKMGCRYAHPSRLPELLCLPRLRRRDETGRNHGCLLVVSSRPPTGICPLPNNGGVMFVPHHQHSSHL